MRKLILVAIIVTFGFGIYNNLKPKYNIPQFTDEQNEIICIEEGI